MDEILTKAVWRIRKGDKPNAEKPVTLIHTSAQTYQLYFASVGCRFACSMCNYGFGDVYSPEETLEELDQILENLPEDVRILVLEASGSFLDEREITSILRRAVFQKISKIEQLDIIDIETHYTTVTSEIMSEINLIFENTRAEIEFEFGVESVNIDVLKIYNKHLNLQRLLDTIWEAEENGIACVLNFLTGAPLLLISEQIQDTLNSVQWVIDNCPSSTTCVLFPVNIKRYTLISELYKKGKYKLIYHWEFIMMLSRIPEQYLNRISIAWWGNMVNYYDGKSAILHPYCCDSCCERLQKFYSDFYLLREKRAELLKEIMKVDCDCKRIFLQTLNGEESIVLPSINERFEKLKEWIRTNL